MIRVGLSLEGDWVGTGRLLKDLPYFVKVGGRKAQLEVVEEIYARVVGHLYNGDLRLAPLSSAYAERKASSYPGQPILLRTNKMVQSIAVYTIGDNASVGIKGHHVEPGTKTKTWLVAKYLEEGTSKMPARPVWSKVYFGEMKGNAGIEARMRKSLKKYLRSKNYPTDGLGL